MTSLAETADRILVGEDSLASVRDFLDVIGRSSNDEIATLIWVRPHPTGDARIDALLAGLAEHLSVTRGVPCPGWVHEPDRFLDHFWFVSRVPGFRAMAIAQTPIALKRRGVFWPARSLKEMAAEMDLPSGWLNDAAKEFVGAQDPEAAATLEVTGLRVSSASPRILLAMKVLAHRVGEDEDDLMILARHMDLSTADQVFEVATAVYGDRLDPAARFFVEELFA